MKKINKNTFLSDVLADEKMAEILAKNNLPCLSCPFAKYEMEQLEIGEVCKKYGINTEKLLKELNGDFPPKKSAPKTRNKKTGSTGKK
jgi:hypothetical protein